MKQTYSKYKSKNTKRYSGLNMLSVSLNKATSPVFKRRGFAQNKIMTDWNLIVGNTYGNCSTPKKIAFSRDKKVNGTLYVEVYDSGVAMEMTYMEQVLVEKMSVYFGYKAVERIKIIQRPGGQPHVKEAKTAPVRELSEVKKGQLDSCLIDIEDEDLKLALRSLGEGVLSDA